MADRSSSVSSNDSDVGVYPASTVISLIRNHNHLVSRIDKLQDEANRLRSDNEHMQAQLRDLIEQKWGKIFLAWKKCV
ncbi:hypothetical protein L6452_30488 [Arctium lappa]|uniref:Uncharacterized protein n=1 Tax=Arctium lappa TaxID=4217 RepID=A0ACB8ZIH8_ARCLA|nr:hypothetical protein L6452_30488 [Arctium lappa]